QIGSQQQRRPQHALQREAEQQQEDHVADEVIEAAVHEHVRKQLAGIEIRGREPEAHPAEFIAQRLELLARGAPFLVRRRNRPVLAHRDVEPGAQQFAEMPEPRFAVVFASLRLHEGLEQRLFPFEQPGFDVMRVNGLGAFAVARLVADEDENARERERQRDPRRTPEIRFLFGRNDEHALPPGTESAGCDGSGILRDKGENADFHSAAATRRRRTSISSATLSPPPSTLNRRMPKSDCRMRNAAFTMNRPSASTTSAGKRTSRRSPRSTTRAVTSGLCREPSMRIASMMMRGCEAASSTSAPSRLRRVPARASAESTPAKGSPSAARAAGSSTVSVFTGISR